MVKPVANIPVVRENEGPARPQGPGRMGHRAVRIGGFTTLTLIPVIALGVLANLPTAEALGGPGTWALPVRLGACIAATAAASSTGPWTGFAVWTGCKALCIAGAVAF